MIQVCQHLLGKLRMCKRKGRERGEGWSEAKYWFMHYIIRFNNNFEEITICSSKDIKRQNPTSSVRDRKQSKTSTRSYLGWTDILPKIQLPLLHGIFVHHISITLSSFCFIVESAIPCNYSILRENPEQSLQLSRAQEIQPRIT